MTVMMMLNATEMGANLLWAIPFV